jgi:hypothetical protein
MLHLGPEFMLFRDFKKFRRFLVISGGIGFTQFNWSWRAGSNSRENYHALGIGIRGSISQMWAISNSLIIGPNFKFQIAAIGDEYGFAGIIPRLNLGLSVLLH